MPQTRLDDEVREMLLKHRGDWRRIADEAGISRSWISQFCRHLIPNPGYVTLTKLRAVLVPKTRREVA
jgi:transcriptional regulator with XRE-family HTH domain